MAFTSIDIQNLALIAIGEEPIESIEDNTKSARILKRIYQITKEAELRKYNWNFAMTRAKISALATDSYDDFGILKQYEIPVDCLRILYVEGWYIGSYVTPILDQDDAQFRIEGNRIITAYNKDELFIRYIKRIEDDTMLDPTFVDVFAYALAIRLAAIITQTTTIKQQIIQQYDLALIDALRANAIEQAPTSLLDNSFITSRL